MSKKKEKSEFVKEIYFKHKNIIVVGDYVNNETKIQVYCKDCKQFSFIRPTNLLHAKQGCIHCKHKANGDLHRKTNDDYQSELCKKYEDRFTLISDYKGNHSRVKIQCNKCNQSFEKDAIYFLNTGLCPICEGRKVVKGINDLWTTHPEIASLFKDKNLGYQMAYKTNGKNKISCICPKCGFEKQMFMKNIIYYGFYCENCDDGISYNEKVIASMLMQLGIKFEKEKIFEWSHNKKYDFYIEDKSCIIEVHGLQHYKYTGLKRSLKEEQENDAFKKENAISNGIQNYIVLDCRKSKIDWIRNSVNESTLPSLFNFNVDDIDWESCNDFAKTSLIETVYHYYQTVTTNKSEIARVFNLCPDTIRKYIKIMSPVV